MITITEALAEIKTVQKRIDKKTEFIMNFLYRQDGIKDPLDRSGGSIKAIEQERQAIGDLHKRMMTLRQGINAANDATTVTINGKVMSISEWLTWRRDVAPSQQNFLINLRARLNQMRADAKKTGVAIVTASATTGAERPTDFIVNIDEELLAKETEDLEEILGQLDGQLSLKNATIAIIG